MLVASFSALYCSITHLRDYQCQPASVMYFDQLSDVLVKLLAIVCTTDAALTRKLVKIIAGPLYIQQVNIAKSCT